MFDIGWMELVLIGIVALIVVGPKDLPKMFRTVGQVMGKARGMAREFQRSMEQAAEESGVREATRELNSINKLNLKSAGSSPRKFADGLMTGPKPKAEDPGAVPAAAPKIRPKATDGAGAGAPEVASDASSPGGDAPDRP